MTGNAHRKGEEVLRQWGEVKEQQKAMAKFESLMNRAIKKKSPVAKPKPKPKK